jgi:hypothetical protein
MAAKASLSPASTKLQLVGHYKLHYTRHAVTWSSRRSSIKLPKSFFILKVFARDIN